MRANLASRLSKPAERVFSMISRETFPAPRLNASVNARFRCSARVHIPYGVMQIQW